MTELSNKTEANVSNALASLKAGISKARTALPTRSTEPILSMATDGVWNYGPENLDVQDKSEWAINPLSIQTGFVCWTNKDKTEGKNELLGEAYAPFGADPIDKTKLPDHGWPWKPASNVTLKCMSGEDKGEQVRYNPSSVGGMNFMQSLMSAISEQLDTGSEDVVPVVTLESDHYKHKSYGKTYVPKFTVVRWVNMDGMETAPPATPKGAEPDNADDAEDAVVVSETPAKAADAPAKTEGRTRRRRRAS